MDEEAETDGEDPELPELQDLIRSSQPSPSPPKKRQRINPPNNPLYKPFKTPLKKSTPSEANQIPSSSPAHSNLTSSSISTPIPEFTTPFPIRNTPSIPRKAPRNSSSSPPKLSPHLDQLQKKHTALLNELSSLRARLETTNQALEIESSTTSAELEELIRKWRCTTRDVADEVFGIMKEKVDGMGGYKAWREKERERAEGARWHEPDDIRKDNGEKHDRQEGTDVKGDELDRDTEGFDEDDEASDILPARLQLLTGSTGIHDGDDAEKPRDTARENRL
ncbi:MAG: hypothetical protein Q9218_005895 [Villophora microphyllina]